MADRSEARDINDLERTRGTFDPRNLEEGPEYLYTQNGGDDDPYPYPKPWGEGFEVEFDDEEGEIDSFEEEDEDEDETEDEAEEKRESAISGVSFSAFVSSLQEEKEKEAKAKEQAEKDKLRKLIGLDKKMDIQEDEVSLESVETPSEATTPKEVESIPELDDHPCLIEVEISDSRLKVFDLFTTYPEPDDPGTVPAFWILYPPSPFYKPNGIQKFRDLSEAMALRPVRCFEEMLRTDKIDLRHYGLDPRLVRAICESTYDNTSVQVLDFGYNQLTEDACFHLNDLLLHNTIVAELNLRGCRIGPSGAKKLVDGLSTTTSLLSLDLSRCELKDEGLLEIVPAILACGTLSFIDLSHNLLASGSAEILKTLLSENESLRHLDLSWNSLFDRETVKSLFKGLLKNYELLSLDLSWNSLDKDCVPFLGPFLARTLSLRRFNLSGNRFSPHDAEAIARSLSRNVSLEEFFLGNNPLKAQGALALVRVLAPNRSPSSSLRHLDLENIWADKNVLPELEKIREERPWLRIRLGGVLGDFQIIGPDPRKLLMDRAIFEAMKPKKRKLKKNFGHFVLTLGDTFASKAQFMEAIKKFKLKLSESLVEEIMKAFSGPKQVVDQGAIKSYFLEQYPDTRPPSPPTEKKAKKAKKAEKKN